MMQMFHTEASKSVEFIIQCDEFRHKKKSVRLTLWPGVVKRMKRGGGGGGGEEINILFTIIYTPCTFCVNCSDDSDEQL